MLRFMLSLATTGRGRTGILFLALSILVPLSAAAQTMSLQNGGTIAVTSGGVWNLHGTTVDLGGTGSTATVQETGGGRFAGGTLTAVRTLDAPSAATPAGLGITISTAANLGDVTVTRGHAVQTAPNGNESIQRYYDLSPSQANSDLDAELTLAYSDGELNGLAESELELFRSTDGGASWSAEGADSRDATANTVTLGGISSLSRWTIGSASSPLPVELVAFDAAVEASARGGPVRLTWRTASETNNAGFEVQRRAESPATVEEGEWTTVGSVEGTGTTAEGQRYRFLDDDLPFAADALAYRLKQVDTDGSARYSETISVTRGVDAVALRRLYPNPAHQQVTVQYALPESRPVTLQLYDVLGQAVRTVSATPGAGRHTQRIDTAALPSGLYFLRLRAGRAVQTQRLTLVH